MRSLKSLGLEECRRLRRRVMKTRALERISRPDSDYLVDLLDRFEARVIEMEEVEIPDG